MKDTTFLNRPAYEMSFDVKSSALSYDHADVAVDVETGVALLVNTTVAGKPNMRWETKAFDVHPDLGQTSFVIPSKDGDDVNRVDQAYVDTQTSLVKSQVGYNPVLPKTLPEGFTLKRVVTKTGRSEPTGAEGSNPTSEKVVGALYKGAGWQQLYVTTRATGTSVSKWSDPLATISDEFGDASLPITVKSGALAPASGQIVLSPATSPHIWAAGNTLVVTVSGPFSVDALSGALNTLT